MRVFRSKETTLFVGIFGLVMTLFLLGGVLPEDRVGGGGKILAVFVAGLLATFSLRCARSGAYANEEGVRVVNPLFTVRLRWDQIDRFSLEPQFIYPGMGFVMLRNGKRIRIWGLQIRSPSRRPSDLERAQHQIGELNELLRRHTTGERQRLTTPEE